MTGSTYGGNQLKLDQHQERLAKRQPGNRPKGNGARASKWLDAADSKFRKLESKQLRNFPANS
jgi:hypothetical protein